MSLRNKLKATPLQNLQQQDQEINEKSGRRQNWADEYKIQPGKNALRLLPAHPDTLSYIYPFSSHWLPMYKKDDNGNYLKDDSGNKIEGRKRIFNSIVHGDTKKDIIEEYIKEVENIANEKFGPYIHKRKDISEEEKENQKDRDKFLIYIYGLFNRNDPSKSIQSIRRDTVWVVYSIIKVDGGEKILRVPLKKTVKDDLLNLAMQQDDPDEMIATDPYTDPDSGRKVFITYNKKPNASEGEKYYSTAVDLNKTTPLTDDQIEEFLKLPSLEELYVNCYKRKDFLVSLEGLEYFDKKYGYGVFDLDSFQNTIMEINDYYVEEESEEEVKEEKKTPKKTVKTTKKKVEKKKEEVKDDLPFDVDEEEVKEEKEKPTKISSSDRLAELRKKLGR